MTQNNSGNPIILTLFGLFALALLIAGGMAGCPRYRVWQQEQSGKAALAKERWKKQIAIEAANAEMESSKALAAAEIERAKGAAKANKIIADGLGGPEGYLRYLWIQSLNVNKQNVIYVPTEAGLPILEAGRLKP